MILSQLARLAPRAVCLPGVCLVAACLDPLVSDAVDRRALIQPTGTVVPELTDDEQAAAVLARAIDLPKVLEPRQAYWDGHVVDWWDLGPAILTPIPGYMLVEEREDGFLPVGDRTFMPVLEHPIVLNSIPGDLGYSPMWRIVVVPITARYAGEVLASSDAIEEAVAEGLVEAPIPTAIVSNCPVVMPTTRLRRVPGGPLEEPLSAYYKGKTVHLLVFDAVFTTDATVEPQAQYVLRRDGDEPLSEIARGVDMNRDGDTTDTNDIFALGPNEPGFSDFVRQVDVVVPADIASIDAPSGDAVALTSDEDLYAMGPGGPLWHSEVVVAVYPTDLVLNHPFAVRAESPPAP